MNSDQFEARLDDGTAVTVRPIRSSDQEALPRLHERLSERSIRMRFFTFVSHAPSKYLAYLANVDGVRRFAYVVEKDGEIIAVGRYEILRDSPKEAEIALLVEDAWQRHGIGTMLLHRLAERARKYGIEKMRAVMLPENHEMIGVLERSGFPHDITFEQGLVVSTLDIR